MRDDKNQFEYLPIEVDDKKSDLTPTTIRMSVDASYELSEKMKDLSYATGKTQAELILEAMREFVKDKNIKGKTDSLKLREKARTGRKRK
jgi:predicted transcriptional regulator